jgi:hypothetical protein
MPPKKLSVQTKKWPVARLEFSQLCVSCISMDVEGGVYFSTLRFTSTASCVMLRLVATGVPGAWMAMPGAAARAAPRATVELPRARAMVVNCILNLVKGLLRAVEDAGLMVMLDWRLKLLVL